MKALKKLYFNALAIVTTVCISLTVAYKQIMKEVSNHLHVHHKRAAHVDTPTNTVTAHIAATELNVPQASSAPMTEMAASVQAAITTAPSDPLMLLSYYDLSTYATDPLYLQKIAGILHAMPALDTAQKIDDYIASKVMESPLTGNMIIAAAQEYNVDTRMLISILRLESNFGTAGIAVATMNPGNIGNTGTSTLTYDSWQNSVTAVAQWLSDHLNASDESSVKGQLSSGNN